MGKQKPRYSIGSWTPGLVKEFLSAHDFQFLSRNGDEVCWIRSDNDNQFMVSFSETRRHLTPGTMRDSVMRQSGYSKQHWEKWSVLRKTERKRANCCYKGD